VLEDTEVVVTIEDYEKIRRLYLIEKKSIRAIARETGIARNTVSKYCEGDLLPGTRKEYSRDNSKVTESIEAFIKSCLLQDQVENHRKQKHTAKRIYDRLCDELNFTGGESTISRYVKELRNEPKEVSIPLAFDPGEAMQIDFGEAYGYYKGTKILFQIFCARLCYSAMPYVFAAPRKNAETFLEGIRRAFEFFGGVPKRLIFDNDKVAVLKNYGKSAVTQSYLQSMMAHYVFTIDFCNRASGNEKGLVEGLVGWARRNVLVPIPHFDSFDALNEQLLNRCVKYGEQHRIQNRSLSVKEQFAHEKLSLLPLPRFAFNTAKRKEIRVDSFGLVKIDGSRFSVPHELVDKFVTVNLCATKVEIIFRKDLVGNHDRPISKGETLFELLHYIDLLERKPRAIMNAKPVKATLSEPLMKFASSIATSPEELVKFLRICVDYKIDFLTAIVSKPYVKTLDLLVAEIEHSHNKERRISELNMPSISVDKVPLSAFDRLIPGGDSYRQC